ncbi:uncharacterized protein DNG_00180 [Cephalotrichum gorgonifer]|uniref:Uncharacterized protein n=1 Tax=Cephalotrichum gorgonifer TaxID=2041049 RepID=A0AAE8MQC8_9PEZI|nr:uncharacterized protein DNG_00180 [Cephalotrichum gorgonifer]
MKTSIAFVTAWLAAATVAAQTSVSPSASLVAATRSTRTQTIMIPCKTGTPGKECPQYSPPREPCTQTLPPTTVTVTASTCEGPVVTVTARCSGWICPHPCSTIRGDTVTVETC